MAQLETDSGDRQDPAESVETRVRGRELHPVEKPLSAELRLLREQLGWTLQQTAELLPGKPAERTVRAYEFAQRGLTVTRFLDFTDLYEVHPEDLVWRARRRAKVGCCPTCGCGR